MTGRPPHPRLTAPAATEPEPATTDANPTTHPTEQPPTPPTPTSTARTPRQLWTRTRGLLISALILLIAAVAIALVRSDAAHGRLDPRSADPNGSRAVAQLLAARGVSTRVVTTTAEARAAAGPDTTVLVASPDLLTDHQGTQLRSVTADSGGRTVLIAPGAHALSTLAPDVTADPAPSLDALAQPGCSLPVARRAGDAETGGRRYATYPPDADACYRSESLPTLLRLPEAHGGDTLLIGAPDIFLNDRLDQQGNASLALQLLGSRPHLVWYLPSLSDDAAATGSDRRGLFDLLPSGWLWGTLQLFVAAVLAAFWRGRRLGRLVPERLPVSIRASEAVEGRARLYRKANARDRAASALRTATRTRLAPLIGVPPSQAHSPETLLPALTAALRTPGQDPRPLLFGPPPADDAALIALADQLDALEREVRHS
ncbi:DUF4350 domain-containing protein [Streptomyces antnestii]|uniref:DUF4350 domain-containing protein n=1 Tax=Streptomyces antnestii TaxID=2494256 RepID=A0A3S2WJQ8_9ACTN|nr:DUF4350 domain-containing protein [Streptomyces sp. San01]RVU24556.1 DUF4350 domain-containing protein [Streptomyces sp. San01]